MGTLSHDVLADRRVAWARALTQEGDHRAAADLLEQAVALAPEWGPAWAALAEARERDGDAAAAAAAWTRVEAIDPDGSLGGAINLARLRGRTPAGMPAAYVRALFDDYAPRFERHLTGTLGYDGPAVVAAALDAVAPERGFRRALDLGCGTGLMARALQGRAARIDGVDLSPAMVERARATALYASLTVGPLDAMLSAADGAAFDLVTAADVFVYLGDLAPTFGGVARVLAAGGLFAFTAQALTPLRHDPAGYELGLDLCFAHAPEYLTEALGKAGLAVLRLDAASVRGQHGRRIPGLVAVARKA